jgi:hypothetical protein
VESRRGPRDARIETGAWRHGQPCIRDRGTGKRRLPRADRGRRPGRPALAAIGCAHRPASDVGLPGGLNEQAGGRRRPRVTPRPEGAVHHRLCRECGGGERVAGRGDGAGDEAVRRGNWWGRWRGWWRETAESLHLTMVSVRVRGSQSVTPAPGSRTASSANSGMSRIDVSRIAFDARGAMKNMAPAPPLASHLRRYALTTWIQIKGFGHGLERIIVNRPPLRSTLKRS